MHHHQSDIGIDLVSIERVARMYQSNGYTVRQDFPGEYVFLFKPTTMERVRVFYTGQILEGPAYLYRSPTNRRA